MKILKITCGDFVNASRDLRELSVYSELGNQVIVIAKGTNGNGSIKIENGLTVHRLSTKPLGSNKPVWINRSVSIIHWIRYAARIRADVISGENIKGLAIGWLSTLFRRNKPKLIYDSHEFEIGRNAKRNKLQKWWVLHLERFLIKRCAFSIMVNDSIADEVQRIHKLKQRPIVVRSTPERWELHPEKNKELRETILREMQNAIVAVKNY